MRKKISRIKRGLAVMLSVCMVFGMAPIQAGAEENDSEIAVQANDSAGKTEQQSTEEEECKHEGVEITFNSNGFGNCPKCNATVYQPAVETNDKYDIDDDGTKDTVYEISNAGQLYWFADKVNNDNATYGSANAVLTEDIVVNENLLDSLDYDADGKVTNGESFIGWACIGWAGWVGQDSVSNQYNGTFDGQNHTVSGLYFNDAGKYNFGLFGVVHNDGSVSNVGVVDSCFYCYGDVGGVCGISYGTISNCYNTGRVSGNNANVGGVCGTSYGTITNCYNTGAVSSNSSRVGGVCGDNNEKISNCYNTGTVSGATAVGGVSGRNVNIITNCYNVGTVRATDNNPNVGGVCGYCWGSKTIESYCYYLDTCAADGTTFNITSGESMTASQFASGEVTYLLNGSKSEGDTVHFYQNLSGENADALPVLDKSAIAMLFATAAVLPEKLPVGVGITANAENSEIVESNSWLEVSCAENNYKTIDYTSSDENTYTCYVYSSTEYSAVLISVNGWSHVANNGVLGYDNQVADLASKGARMPKFAELQILLDAGMNLTKFDNFNCQEYEVAWVENGKWRGQKGNNKYADSTYHAVFEINRNPIETVSDSIFKTDSSPTLSAVKGEDFTWQGNCDIEISYYNSDKTICDSAPAAAGDYYVKVSTPTIEADEDGNTVRYEASESDYIPFTIVHNFPDTFDSNGFKNCPKCNATVYQPATETTDKYDIDDDGTKEAVYEISNAGQLYWFAGLVNGTLDGVKQNTSANAILTANITVNENLLDSLQYDAEGNVSNGSDFISWTPIADCMEDHTTQYSGTFDGNNKTVSGLYLNGNSTRIGLFGSSEADGNIKNVGVVDSYFKGNDFVGGVCGRNDGTITNCYNAGNLTAIDPTAAIGGICGYNDNGGTIANCYNTGTVTATGSVASVGGVCGCSLAPISNCYNIGTVTATSSGADISGICGFNYGPITNCYYLADTEDENGGKTAAQFASGEIAYLLSQGCTVGEGEGENAVTYSGSVWGQALGENGDTYPVLDSTKRVYQVDKYYGCKGKPGSSTKVYSNQSTSIYEEHKYEADATDSTKHKCSICNGTEEHSFAYEFVENGNAIKATCSECGATYTVKLTQPAATSDEKIVYDGTEKKAGTAIDSGNTGIETIPENVITYAAVTNGKPSTYSTKAPKNAGTYKAKLTLGTGDNIVSIEISFTIEKATPTLNWADNATEKNIIYTGNAITADNLPAIIVGLQKDEEYKGTVMYSYSRISDNNISGNDELSDGLPDRFPEEVGSTYKVKARIEATDNYTAAESDILTLKVGYLDGKNIPDAIIEEWNEYKTITLKAPDGYYISLTSENTTAGKVEYTSTSGNEEDTVTYYLQRISDKAIAEKTITVKYDKAAPDWSGNESGIRIKSTWWNKLLSSVTFGLYKGGSLDVYAKANDSQSGVAEYYYYIDNSGSTTTLTAEELGTKTFTKVDAGKNVTTKLTEIKSDNDYVIYAYAVDAAGNRSTYISSDGVVLDNTAPKLTNVSEPAKSNETLSDTSATITFTGSEAGTYYYILKENGKTAPTVMSDFAAKTAGDKVDTWTAKDGVSTGNLTADEANTIKLTGLKANTGYVLYLAATDAAGNASVAESARKAGDSGVVSVSFTTAKTTPYVKTAPVLSGTYGNKFSELFWSMDAVVVASQGSTKQVSGSWSIASEDADKLPTVGTSEKYTLIFTPTGSDADTYDYVTCEVTPEVSKKQITVVIADKEKFYGETNPALTWSLATGAAYPDNVLVAADTEEALGISLSTTAKDNSDVGTYAITGSSDSANYEVSFIGSGSDGKSGILTVKQAANSFTTELSCSDYTYAKDETPKPDAAAKFGTVTYKYATVDSDGNAPTADSAYTDAIPVNAGIYAVKAYVAETDNYAGLTSDPVVFTINKAAEPTIAGEERSYAYSAGSDGKAVSVDIAGKLPTDRGTTAYALTKTNNEQLLRDVAVDQDGSLTYTVNEADKSQVGAAATITVTASMINYEDAVYTMTIKITDKKLVTLKSGNTVSVNGSNALIYGDKLSKLSLSSATFVEADTNTEVKGTLKWTDPDCMPTAGTTQAGWVFKPADSKHYEELTGTAAITVAKATPAVVTVPTVAERVYNPAVALADSDMTGASVTGADGNSLAGTWSFTGKNIIPIVNNNGYQAVFTPDDTNNYKTVTKTITVKVTKATPVIAEKPTAGALTYGQKLSDSTLTGGKAAYQTADGTEITGAFAWKNSSIKPTAADSQKTEYDVTFTPSDKDNYNAVDTKLVLTVNKAAQAPNMPQAAMAPAHSTKKVGDITLPDGWSWQEDDKDTALADGVAVTANAIYTGTDKGNYETESVSITITRSECEHKNTEIINKKDATCSVEGYTGDTYCKDCGETLATGTAIEKKPHTVGTSATCVSKAVCSVCGEAFGEVDASNHVHTTVKNLKEATCTQTGYTGDTYCADCNKLLGMGKELAALGHSYTSKVTKAATTTEEGIMTYTCSKCGHSYTQPIAKLKIDDGNEDNGNNNSTSIKPYIKDDSGKEGWDVIKPQLEKAKSGETVTVAMNGTSVVPKTVIDSIKGKDTTLVLDIGNGLSWKINGKEITDAAGDIDFGVTIGADAGKSIPVDVINNVTGERYSMNLSLAYDGEFGFTATLTVNMEPKNSGMYANLFYYNEQTGKLEFVSAGQIDSDGNVELAFTHASDYTIVVAANIMNDNSQAANNANETIPSPKTDDSISKYAWNNTMIIIIGICIILIVFGAVIFVRKKSGSEEE